MPGFEDFCGLCLCLPLCLHLSGLSSANPFILLNEWSVLSPQTTVHIPTTAFVQIIKPPSQPEPLLLCLCCECLFFSLRAQSLPPEILPEASALFVRSLSVPWVTDNIGLGCLVLLFVYLGSCSIDYTALRTVFLHLHARV